jgi:ABC-type glycerol-3-phosphate transport system permease component
MQAKTLLGRISIYVLLVAGSLVFLLPFIWLMVTSLKPIEQTMIMPPTWIPRAYTATVQGQRMEVTKDFVVQKKSVLVMVDDGPQKGQRLLLPEADLDRANGRAKLQLFEGGMQQSRYYPVKVVRAVEPARARHRAPTRKCVSTSSDGMWFPEADIDAKAAPRWDTLPQGPRPPWGGRDLEEVEGSMASRTSGISQDTRVGFVACSCPTPSWSARSGSWARCSPTRWLPMASPRSNGSDATRLFAVTLATMMVPFPVLMVPLYGVFSRSRSRGLALPAVGSRVLAARSTSS